MLPVESPFKTFTGLDGKPLNNGYVYFGLPDQNPITAQIEVFWDSAGTIPAAQPLRTVNGYVVRAGTPANVFADVDYSVVVQDSKKRQVFYARDSSEFSTDSVVSTVISNLAGDNGASLVGLKRNANGAIKYSIGSWHAWQPVSVLEFMTDAERADVTSGSHSLDVSAAVQKAVDYCLASKRNLLISGLCRVDAKININRAVDSTTDEFYIIGENSNGGFYTDKAISIFSSSIPGFTPGGASSDWVIFDNLRWEASDNTVNCFALDGDAFLRVRVRNCYFRKMRMAKTTNFFQSWYLSGNNIRKMKGVFMEAVISGDSYVGLDGYGFDLHFLNNIIEDGDTTQSAFLKLAGNYNGGSMVGNLCEGVTGPFLEAIGGGTVEASGNYFEAMKFSCFKLGTMFTFSFNGNRFGTGSDPAYFPIDCQTSYTVIGQGNFSEGNLYKSSSMQSTKVLADNNFYKTKAKGLISIGDVAYNGNITDDPNHSNNFQSLQTEVIATGKDDFTFGAGLQTVAKFRSDGVSGASPTGSFNWKTKSGFRDSMTLELWLQDKANGEYSYPLVSAKNDSFKVTGYIEATVGYKLPQFTTVARPAPQPGVLIYDSSLGKMLVGEASGWKVVTTS